MTNGLDEREHERTIEAVYRGVATAPHQEHPVETGRALAERLGYSPADLDRVPSGAVDSFAGVGFHLDLAAISGGDDVLVLGSGSGMDAFVAALHAGPDGRVTGIDMTVEQVTKSRRLRDRGGFDTLAFERGYVEDLPFEDDAFDVVLSNGTITLSTRKERTFREVGRVVTPGGRLAASEVVSERELPECSATNAERWAAGIGGAMHVTAWVDEIEAAGFEMIVLRENPRAEFRTGPASDADPNGDVTSISLVADER